MSRESDLYKDKIEVSLDGRQIFYLFFGGAVIVGLVFVLGVMVGRRVEARGHVERAHVEATVDPLAALDRLEGGGGLSFPGALRGADAPANDVEKTIAVMQKDAHPVDPKKADDKKPDAKKLDKAADAAPAADKKADEPKKADDKKADKKASDKADKKADKNADEPKKADDKKAEDAGKKADDGVKKAEADKKPEAEKKPKFTLQLSSFKDKNEAEAFLDTIKSAGYQGYVTEGDVDGKQYYRVRMGSYRSLDAANDAKADFEKSVKKSALVTKL
jgi:DedD protein